MYVNDIDSYLCTADAGVSIQNVKILSLFFADDLVIFNETPEGLQAEIDRLYLYCNKWKLKLNTSKSQIMVFKKGNQPVNHEWRFGDDILTVSNKIPYLGIIFTSNGIFNQAQIALAEKANKSIFMLYKKLSYFKDLKPSFMLDMFEKFISPVLFYGCEVWGFHPAKNVEALHLRYCKNVLKVRKNTLNVCVYGELGRFPLIILRNIRIIQYWLKIVLGQKSHYVNICYNDALLNIDVGRQTTWVKSVRSLLMKYGFGEVWYNQGVGNFNSFMKIFRERCFDHFKQDWHSEITEHSRSRFYLHIKPVHCFSEYLDKISVPKFRIALTRLVVSSHNLEIETGRWKRPIIQPNNRFCPHCPMKIGDEYHLIFECHLYDTIRKNLFPNYYLRRPSMYKLVQLFTNESPSLLKRLSKFIYQAFEIRQTTPTL
jgi:hypothetical protein